MIKPELSALQQEDGTTLLKTTCPFCDEERELKLTMHIMIFTTKCAAWQAGQPIQQAFPELSNDEREFMISGICNKCWDEVTT